MKNAVELWYQPDNMATDVPVQLLSTNMIRFFFAEFWLPNSWNAIQTKGNLTPPKRPCPVTATISSN